MTTKHPRLNITLEEQHMALLARLAEREQKSLSSTAKALIIEALDLQEDIYLSGVAAACDRRDTKWVSHEDAWKE